MNKIKNMMRSIIGLCVICASVLVGCVHEDLSAVASVDEKIVTVDSSVNLYSYTITANTDWTFVSSDSWCEPSVTSGSGTTKVNLIITANDTSAERTATLTLTCGGKDTYVTVIQSGMSTSIEVAPAYITLDSNANNASIAVMANTSWSASCVSDWVTLTDVPGTGNDIIKFSVKENTTYAEREAIIYIAVSETISKSVTVKQLSQGLPSITLGAESISLAKEASSHTISYVSNITGLTAASEFSWCTVAIDEAAATITVTALQNSTSSSRSSIVTVSGIVDGVTTSAQIIVSQAGTGSPSISLLNSSLSFGATPAGSATVSWVATNDAAVTASYSDSWISQSVGSDSMTVSVEGNTSTESRVGTIELKATNASGEYAYYYITVSQDGVGAATIYATPGVATLSAYDTAGVIYLTTSNVTLSSVSSSNSWLSAQLDGNTISYTTTSTNTSDAMRTATITVSYTANSVPSLYTISVSQNGLGAPVLSSLDNIFMQTAASTVDYDVYLVATDINGTTLEVVSVNCDVASSTTSSANTDWLSATVADNSTLDLKTDDNTSSDSRTATVTFRVIRDNAVAYKSFTVTQAGHLSAGITGLTQEIYVDYEGIADGDVDSKYGFLTINGSTVSVMSTPSWVSSATITEGTTGDTTNDYILTILVDEYTGGETGSFREGYITLVASNGNATDAYYEILVRQYEPEAAMIDCISEIVLSHEAYKDTISTILLNGSEIVDVTVTGAEDDWLEAAVASDDISIDYTASKYTGPEASRTAIIAITVENSNANKYIHYISVTQLLTEITSITATETTTVGYSALEALITYSTNGSGTVTVVPTTDASNTWVKSITAEDGVATVTFTATNTTLVDRKATIQLVATSADNVTTATTYATIIQTAAPAATLEVSEKLSAIAAGETINILYTVGGYSDETVTTSVGVDWISAADAADGVIALTISENVEAESRTATIEVTAKSATTGSSVIKYVEVTQAGSGDAVMTVTPSVAFDYTGATTATITPIFMDGATIVEAVSSEDWVSSLVYSTDSSKLTYVVDAYDGAEGDSRFATITIKAVSAAGIYSTSYVTVTQTAPADITISAPEAVNVAAYGIGTDGVTTANVSFVAAGNVSDADDLKVSATFTDASWITSPVSGKEVDASAGKIEFTLAKNETSSPRSAVILLTAYDDAEAPTNVSTATQYVTITQAAATATTLSLPANISIAATDASVNVPYTATGDGDVTVVATPEYGTLFTADATFTGEDSPIKFTEIVENTDSASRSCVVTVVATSATGQVATEYFTITQAGTGEAMISTQNTISLDYADTDSVEVTPTLSTNSVVYKVESSDVSWLTVDLGATSDATTFKYTAAAYDGAQGTSRIATITITAENGGSYDTTYVTVTQSAPAAITFSTVEAVSAVAAAEESGSITAVVSYVVGGDINTLAITSIDNVEWITGMQPDTTNNTVEFTLTANESSAPRSASVILTASDGSGDNASTATSTVVITQAGTGEALISTTSNIEVAYTAITDAAVAPVLSDNTTITKVVSSASWLTVTLKDGGESFSYTTLANTSTEPRIATITVTAENGGTYATSYITVTQAAPAAITLTAPANVSAAADGNATISYVVSGDGTPTVAATYNESWITTTSDDNGTVTVTLADNTSSAARSAEVVLTASSTTNASTATTTVIVTQAGTGEALISTTSNIEVAYTAITEAAIVAPVLSDNTTITKVVSSASWLTVTLKDGGESFSYTTLANTSTEPRIATITVTAENGGTYATSYITVTQAAPAAITFATAEAVSAVASVSSGNITAVVSYVAGGDYTTLAVTSTENADWITDMAFYAETNTITFTLAENTSSAPRSASVILTASDGSGDNASTATSTVVITQAGTGEALISTTSNIEVAYTVTDAAIVAPVLSDNTTITKVVSSASWLTVTFEDGGESFSYTTLANTSTEPRIATITVTAENGGTYATSYITVTQAAPAAIALTAPANVSAAADGNASISYVVSGDGTPTVAATYNESWITTSATSYDNGTVTVTLADNTSSAARSAEIVLTASSDASDSTATTTVIVTQAGTGEALISTTSNIEVAYTATESAVTVAPVLSDNTTISKVESSADWLVVALDGTDFTYSVDANTSSETRIATITVTAVNGGTYATSYITVTQAGLAAITLTAADEIVVAASEVGTTEVNVGGTDYIVGTAVATTATVSYTVTGDATEIAVTASSDASWVTASSDASTVTYTNGDAFVFDVEANTSTQSRSTVITLTAAATDATENATTAIKYITITQTGAEDAFMSTVDEIVIDAVNGEVYASYAPILGTNTYLYTVTSSASWLGIDDSTYREKASNSTSFSYYASPYDGANGSTRSATITIVANRGESYVTSVITVTQNALEAIAITAPANVSAAADGNASIAYVASGYGTLAVDATSGESWVTAVTGNTTGTLTIALKANTSSAARTAEVVLKAYDSTTSFDTYAVLNASTATTTVTITQAGTGEALISTTSNIEFDYEAIETAALVVPVLSDNTTITKVVSSASWLTVTPEDGGESFSYTTLANTSTEPRIATITVTAKNGDTYATSYITVTQGAAEVVEPTVVTLTAPEEVIYVDYIAQNVSFSVASTTTEADAASISVSCATAGIDSSPSVSGDVVTVALVANESTTSSITHSVIVTATSNGVAVSKVVTIVQSATPTADATVVTLTAPEATISVDAAEQNVSFSVASTTTEANAATITASCATATVEIAESGDVVTVALAVNDSTTSSITHSVIVTATSADKTAVVSKVVTIVQSATFACPEFKETITYNDVTDVPAAGVTADNAVASGNFDLFTDGSELATTATVNSSGDWVTGLSVDTRTGTVSYTVNANEEGIARTATITVTRSYGDVAGADMTFTIAQLANEFTVASITPSGVTLENTAGTTTVSLVSGTTNSFNEMTAGTTPTFTTSKGNDATWLTATVNETTGVVTLTADANSSSARETTVTVTRTYGTITDSQSFSVTQYG
ncbi:MAG: BACON domain-containing carbohydrate-binding protein [Rikenellaceae bacterium]